MTFNTIDPKKQVSRSHYKFSKYMGKPRWISVWHQLDETLKFQPNNVLEIGPGSGIFKAAGTNFDLNITTLDIDPDLQPDLIGSATDIPFPRGSFDVACAFQVLEHMPYEISLKALEEMCRVAKKAVIISLPDVETCWPSTISVPKLGSFHFKLPRPFFNLKEHIFDGEHYWELNKKGYPLNKILTDFLKILPTDSKIDTYRIHENIYHRMFVFSMPATHP